MLVELKETKENGFHQLKSGISRVGEEFRESKEKVTEFDYRTKIVLSNISKGHMKNSLEKKMWLYCSSVVLWLVTEYTAHFLITSRWRQSARMDLPEPKMCCNFR